MPGREPRTIDRRGFLRLGIATAVALGATGLAACDSAGAKGPETPPTASASQTPGASEAPTQTPEQTTQTLELDITTSDVYNGLSEKDKAMVDEALKMSLDKFKNLSVEDRAVVALVLAEAAKPAYLVVSQEQDPSAGIDEEYINLAYEDIKNANPEWIKKGEYGQDSEGDSTVVPGQVNVRIMAAFSLVKEAQNLPDTNPKKQAAYDAAQKILAGTFIYVKEHTNKYQADQTEIYTWLVERLDAVYGGDNDEMYNLNDYEDDGDLPTSASSSTDGGGWNHGWRFTKNPVVTDPNSGKNMEDIMLYSIKAPGKYGPRGESTFGYVSKNGGKKLKDGTVIYPWAIYDGGGIV